MIRRIKTHIFLLLFFTLTLASFFSLWWWMRGEFKSKKTELSSIQKEVVQLKFRELYAKSFDSLLNEISEQEQELLDLFVSEDDIPTVLENLEQNDFLKRTNMKISSLKPNNENIIIKIKGTGSFVATVKALDYLANIPKAAFLKSFNLTYQDNAALWKYDAEVVLLKK